MCGEGAARRAVRLCVIGYGKLGGMELGYASDLDLVFLHDSSGAQQETRRRPRHRQPGVLPALRAAHGAPADDALGAPGGCTRSICACGRAARRGLLITSIAAFADYQRHEAWTWEHQALLHARAVAGAAPR